MVTDTVLTLEGKIGRENLSTQAKKRISSYNSLKSSILDLENAYKTAPPREKSNYEIELDKANDLFHVTNKETISFLQDELEDLIEKRNVKAAKEKAKADAEELKKQKAEEQEKAKIESEKAKKLAEETKKQAQNNADDNNNNAASKSGEETDEKKTGVSGIILGVAILGITFGAVNYFKNRR